MCGRDCRSAAAKRGKTIPRPHAFALIFLVAVTLAAGGLLAPRAACAQAEPDHVLLLGNSFLRGVGPNLRRMVQKNRGVRLRVVTRAAAGWTLAKHAASSATSRHLERAAWDWVVVQEQSAGIDELRYPDAEALHAQILDAGARMMFFMTWRDRTDPLSDYDSLLGVSGGSTGYVPIAVRLDAPIAPVGWAIREGIATGLPYDYWGPDGHHLNRLGGYLAACVLYAALTGESPAGGWAPGKLQRDGSAAAMQDLAATTVLAAPEDWLLW
jgi:hypothetical protein